VWLDGIFRWRHYDKVKNYLMSMRMSSSKSTWMLEST
jgi:hypothetical protein